MTEETDQPGAPQGPTTGRWELIQRAKGDKHYKRWTDVPLWYRVLDRFGLPTLFAISLGAALWHFADRALTSWEKQGLAWAGSLDRLTEKIERVIFVPAPQPNVPEPKPEKPRRRP